MDKGQGLPITTIVIAALALLVLVILFAITTGRLSIFAGAVNECPGVCKLASPPTTLSGVLEAGTNCTDFEKEMTGKYIAGQNLKSADKPIVCKVCCAQLA